MTSPRLRLKSRRSTGYEINWRRIYSSCKRMGLNLMTNVSDPGRRQHLTRTQARSVNGPGEIGVRNLTVTFYACSSYDQFTKKKRWGVASRYFLLYFNALPRTGVFTLGTRRITTRGSLYGVSYLLSLPASHVLISNSDPRMWLHSNSVAGLFRALWHARHSIAGRCSTARLGSSLWRGNWSLVRARGHGQNITSGGTSLRDGRD